jgi:hypothetical protein
MIVKQETFKLFFCFDIINDGLGFRRKAHNMGNKGQFYCPVAGVL